MVFSKEVGLEAGLKVKSCSARLVSNEGNVVTMGFRMNDNEPVQV